MEKRELVYLKLCVVFVFCAKKFSETSLQFSFPFFRNFLFCIEV